MVNMGQAILKPNCHLKCEAEGHRNPLTHAPLTVQKGHQNMWFIHIQKHSSVPNKSVYLLAHLFTDPMKSSSTLGLYNSNRCDLFCLVFWKPIKSEMGLEPKGCNSERVNLPKLGCGQILMILSNEDRSQGFSFEMCSQILKI